MPNQITVTAVTGPGVTNTAQVYSDPNAFNLDFQANTVTVFPSDRGPIAYSLSAVTTITDTITDGIHDIVVSI